MCFEQEVLFLLLLNDVFMYQYIQNEKKNIWIIPKEQFMASK